MMFSDQSLRIKERDASQPTHGDATTSDVEFLFNGEYSRPSPFANIFIGHLECRLCDEMERACSYYGRCVDDTLAVERS